MQVPIPDDWLGEWCNWSICWPDSVQWQGILAGVLTLPARGRFWDASTGTITTVQDVGREIRDKNLPLEGCIMSCNDGVMAAAFEKIASSIELLANRQCCDNLQIDVQGGFQGTITQGSGEVVPIYGSEPPAAPEPGAFPEQYETQEEYLADKCKQANSIVSGVITALQNLATITTFNAVVLATLIAVSMPTSIIFPPAAIPTAISVLIILSASTFLIAQLAALLQEHYDEYVCILYEGENTTAIMAALVDFIDILLGLIPVSGLLATTLKILFMLVNNVNNINKLFNGAPITGFSEVDCGGCAAACSETHYVVEFGAVTDGSFADCGATVVSQNVDIGCDRFDLSMWEDAAELIRVSRTLETITPSTTLSGAGGGCAGTPIYRLYDEALSLVYSSSTPPTGPIEFSAMAVVASQAGFHLDIVIS